MEPQIKKRKIQRDNSNQSCISFPNISFKPSTNFERKKPKTSSFENSSLIIEIQELKRDNKRLNQKLNEVNFNINDMRSEINHLHILVDKLSKEDNKMDTESSNPKPMFFSYIN